MEYLFLEVSVVSAFGYFNSMHDTQQYYRHTRLEGVHCCVSKIQPSKLVLLDCLHQDYIGILTSRIILTFL